MPGGCFTKSSAKATQVATRLWPAMLAACAKLKV